MQLVVTERGEAVHLHDGEAPVLEIRGQLHRVEGPHLEAGDTQTLLRGIVPKDEFQELERNGLMAFEYRYGESTFFRMMAFREDGSVRAEVRRVL